MSDSHTVCLSGPHSHHNQVLPHSRTGSHSFLIPCSLLSLISPFRASRPPLLLPALARFGMCGRRIEGFPGVGDRARTHLRAPSVLHHSCLSTLHCASHIARLREVISCYDPFKNLPGQLRPKVQPGERKDTHVQQRVRGGACRKARPRRRDFRPGGS